jgi:hypothetical protein
MLTARFALEKNSRQLNAQLAAKAGQTSDRESEEGQRRAAIGSRNAEVASRYTVDIVPVSVPASSRIIPIGAAALPEDAPLIVATYDAEDQAAAIKILEPACALN